MSVDIECPNHHKVEVVDRILIQSGSIHCYTFTCLISAKLADEPLLWLRERTIGGNAKL